MNIDTKYLLNPDLLRKGKVFGGMTSIGIPAGTIGTAIGDFIGGKKNGKLYGMFGGGIGSAAGATIGGIIAKRKADADVRKYKLIRGAAILSALGLGTGGVVLTRNKKK